MKNLTVVMYHYVRDLKHSRYPDIKGLDVSLFKDQIAYIKRHYTPVTMQEVIDAFDVRGGVKKLPQKAILLTFDDAYIDHFTTVFPILHENKIQGCFYAPVKAITENTVLDVNKIHFIIEQTHYQPQNIAALIDEIKQLMNEAQSQYQLLPFDQYFNRLAVASRFDCREIVFIKRLLQVGLPEALRSAITQQLFEKYVLHNEITEQAFSRELYMNVDQMRCMAQCGMHIGAHGYDHYWLGSLPREKQEFEIQQSVAFIKSIGGDVTNWTICYPYGNYNETTIDLCKQYGCKLGLTTEVDLADTTTPEPNAPYRVPRLDTNDLPKDQNTAPNTWYTKTI